jgi:hypothetical protein
MPGADNAACSRRLRSDVTTARARNILSGPRFASAQYANTRHGVHALEDDGWIIYPIDHARERRLALPEGKILP